MRKNELRQLYLEKRQALTAEEYLQKNLALQTKVLQFFQQVPSNQIVGSFLPILKKKEIDTAPIHTALSQFPYLHTFCFPRVTSPIKMDFFTLKTEETPEISNWGIPEPPENIQNLVHPNQLNYILVPLLAYDASGHRVGYGKGFYDQYLANCAPNLVKIGLSLFSESTEIDDLEPSDIALDLIITP